MLQVPVDATVSGTINHVWDRTDAYRLAIPAGYYANITVSSDDDDPNMPQSSNLVRIQTHTQLETRDCIIRYEFR